MVRQLRQGVTQGSGSQVGHDLGDIATALHRQRRRGQQTLVQLLQLLLVLRIGDQAAGQLFQQARGRQQQRRAQNVEGGVDHGDAHLVDAAVQNRQRHQGSHHLEHDQQRRGAEDIKAQVHQRGAAGIAVGAHRGEHGRYTGADVLAHDNGDGRAEGHLSGGGQGLQNTHRGGGGLDDSRQHGAGHHAQNRIGKQQQDIAEGGHIPQARHSAGHGIHAEHQHRKAQQDHAGIPALAALARHHIDHADERQDRCKGGGLEQLHKKVTALDAGQAEDPGGDRGSHVGAHDHIDGLAQRHQSGVDKAHHHHRGGGGGLDHRRDSQAGEKARRFAGGQPAQHGFQSRAGPAFQRAAHLVHTEEEKAQTADQRQNIKKVQETRSFLKFAFVCLLRSAAAR